MNKTFLDHIQEWLANHKQREEWQKVIFEMSQETYDACIAKGIVFDGEIKINNGMQYAQLGMITRDIGFYGHR